MPPKVPGRLLPKKSSIDDIETGDPTRLVPRLRQIHKLGQASTGGIEDLDAMTATPGGRFVQDSRPGWVRPKKKPHPGPGYRANESKKGGDWAQVEQVPGHLADIPVEDSEDGEKTAGSFAKFLGKGNRRLDPIKREMARLLMTPTRRAVLLGAPTGALLGAGIGAAGAEKGERGKGVLKGALIGAGTGTGVGLGWGAGVHLARKIRPKEVAEEAKRYVEDPARLSAKYLLPTEMRFTDALESRLKRQLIGGASGAAAGGLGAGLGLGLGLRQPPKEKDSSFEWAEVGPNQPKSGWDPPKIWKPKKLPFTKVGAKPYRERVEVFARTPGGKVLVGQYPGDQSIGTFGGGIDPGEDPIQAGRREFREESGRLVRNVRPMRAAPFKAKIGPSEMVTPKQRRRAAIFEGTRTQYLMGDLGPKSKVKSHETGTYLKDVRLRPLGETIQLQQQALVGKKGIDKRRIERRLQVLRELEKQGQLYHGSPRKVETLKPRYEHGDPRVPPAVFASPSETFALAYAGRKWGDRDINQSTRGGNKAGQMILREMRPGALQEVYGGKKGYLYEVPKEPFRALEGRRTIKEVVSTQPVRPLRVKEVPDVLQALKNKPEVKLHPYNPRDPETRTAIRRQVKRMREMDDGGKQYLKWRLAPAPPEVKEMFQEEMSKQADAWMEKFAAKVKPKGIKFVYMDTGGGHKAQAKAMAEAAKKKGIPAELVDWKDHFAKGPHLKKYEKAYEDMLHGKHSQLGVAIPAAKFTAMGTDHDKLRKWVDKNRDQAVVLTMEHLKREFDGIDHPVHTLHSDPVIWPFASSGGKDPKRIDIGLPSVLKEVGAGTRVPISNVPVSQAVLHPKGKSGLMERGKFNVTVSAGSLGPEIEPITEQVLRSKLPENAVVHAVAGQNKGALRRLKRMARKDPRLRPHGFAPLPKMMREADLNVVRTHGTTFAETVASGKPSVYYGPKVRFGLLESGQGDLTMRTAIYAGKKTGQPSAIGMENVTGAVDKAVKKYPRLLRRAGKERRRMGDPASDAVRQIMKPRVGYLEKAATIERGSLKRGTPMAKSFEDFKRRLKPGDVLLTKPSHQTDRWEDRTLRRIVDVYDKGTDAKYPGWIHTGLYMGDGQIGHLYNRKLHRGKLREIESPRVLQDHVDVLDHERFDVTAVRPKSRAEARAAVKQMRAFVKDSTPISIPRFVKNLARTGLTDYGGDAARDAVCTGIVGEAFPKPLKKRKPWSTRPKDIMESRRLQHVVGYSPDQEAEKVAEVSMDRLRELVSSKRKLVKISQVSWAAMLGELQAMEKATAEPGEKKLQQRFGRLSEALEEHGVDAGTHRRIVVPKRVLSETDVERLGFRPSRTGVPEVGQVRFTSFRHPKDPHHLHDHGKVWTMHRDKYPPSKQGVVRGIHHMVVEGAPASVQYVRDRLRGRRMAEHVEKGMPSKLRRRMQRWAPSGGEAKVAEVSRNRLAALASEGGALTKISRVSWEGLLDELRKPE